MPSPLALGADMRRRDFITLIGGAAAWSLTARAQQGERMRRVGVLNGGDEGDQRSKSRFSWLVQDLAELGWIDGRNLRLDVRWSAGDLSRIKTSAKELVDLKPDVIFVITPAATRALQQETKTIPIVFEGVGDPVAGGLLKNLSKPEGNTRASPTSSLRWAASGWNCSRRQFRASPGSLFC